MGEIVGYARESSDKQEKDGNALTKQIQRLRNAGATKVFYDVAQRSNNKRDGISQLIKYVESSPIGSIKKIIFTRVDRLTSNIVLFSQLLAVLKKHKVLMEALDDKLDMETLGGKLATNIRVIAAEFETEMLSLRISKDIEVRRQHKRPHYITPFGYVTVGEKHDRYELDRSPCVCTLHDRREWTRADIARYVYESYLLKRSYRQTSKHLNEFFGVSCRAARTVKDKDELNLLDAGDDIASIKKPTPRNPGLGWTAKGLQLWLRNPVLAGGTAYDRRKRNKYSPSYGEDKIEWGTHPEQMLITMQERDELLAIIRGNTCNSRAAQEITKTNVYSRLLHCDHCNAVFFIGATKFSNPLNDYVAYYQCHNYTRNHLCDNRLTISSRTLEQELIPLLCQKAASLAALEDEPVKPVVDEPQQVTTLRNQLRQLTAIPGNNPAITQAIEAINKQIDQILLEHENQYHKDQVGKERIIKAFSNPAYWQSLKPEDKRALLKGCLKSVRISNGKIVSVIFRGNL